MYSHVFGADQAAGAGQSRNNTIPSEDTRYPNDGELADSKEPLWAHALKHDMQALFSKELSELREECRWLWIQHDITLKQAFLTKTHDMPSWAVVLKTDMQATIREELSHMYEQWSQPHTPRFFMAANPQKKDEGLTKDIKDKVSKIDAESDDRPKHVPTVYGTRGVGQLEEAAAMESGLRQLDDDDTSPPSPQTTVFGLTSPLGHAIRHQESGFRQVDGDDAQPNSSEISFQVDVATRSCDPTRGVQAPDPLESNESSSKEKTDVRQQLAELGASKDKHWTSYQIRIERMVRSFIDFSSGLQEPEHHGLAAYLVASQGFEIVCTCVIALNSVFVAYTANFGVQNIRQQRPDWMSIIDKSFTIFYVIEWLIRLSAHRCWYFLNRWNIFDTIVVAISVIDLASEAIFHAHNDTKNLVIMRLLRFLKLTKLLRTVRALRFFSDLAVMLESFACSAVAFFWVLVMVVFLFYVGSLVFLQGLGDYVTSLDPTAPGFEARVSDVRHYFGSVEACMLTLFAICTGGLEWWIMYDILRKCGPVYAASLLFLIFFWQFVFLNIVTGIAVGKAAEASRPSRDDLVMDQRLHDLTAKDEFRCMCKVFDPDNTGMITYDNFSKQKDNDLVISYLESLDLEVQELDLFFQLIAGDRCQDRISVDRFVDGCMSMKGDASGVDVQKAIFQISVLNEDVRKVMEQNAMIMKSLQTTHCVMNADQKVMCSVGQHV